MNLESVSSVNRVRFNLHPFKCSLIVHGEFSKVLGKEQLLPFQLHVDPL